MTVERMWPTCIGLATLGEEKSMTTVRGSSGGVMPGNPPASSSPSASAIQASRSRTLRNPGPAISGGPASGSSRTAPATAEASSRGLARGLGQRHAAVGLVIAEFGVGRGAHGASKDLGVSPRGGRRGKGGPDSFKYIHETCFKLAGFEADREVIVQGEWVQEPVSASAPGSGSSTKEVG